MFNTNIRLLLAVAAVGMLVTLAQGGVIVFNTDTGEGGAGGVGADGRIGGAGGGALEFVALGRMTANVTLNAQAKGENGSHGSAGSEGSLGKAGGSYPGAMSVGKGGNGGRGGTGGTSQAAKEKRIAHNTLLLSKAHPSHIILPMYREKAR